MMNAKIVKETPFMHFKQNRLNIRRTEMSFMKI